MIVNKIEDQGKVRTYASRMSRIFVAVSCWSGTSPLLGVSRWDEDGCWVSSGSWVSSSLITPSVRGCFASGKSVASETERRLRFLDAAFLVFEGESCCFGGSWLVAERVALAIGR